MSKIIIKKNGPIDDDDNFHEYEFENINYSFMNALRRTILSDIPVYTFNGFPNLLRKKNMKEQKDIVENIVIEKNTTRLNNEIIKQRLTCIPIHLPVSKDYKNLVFKLDTTNLEFEEDIIPTVKYITTEHFRIFEIDDDDTQKEIKVNGDTFNPLKPFVTKDDNKHYILIIRLNPEISKQIPREELILTCKLSIHTSKENGSFNAVSCCSYSYYPDKVKQETEWLKFKSIEERKISSIKLNDDDKKNWYNLNGKRHYIPDKFKFIIESLGIYSCDELIKKALTIIITKLENFKTGVANPTNITNVKYKFICDKALINIPYAYDITLTGEDYTIGKPLEYILHNNMDKYNLVYVGFIKKHPHDTDSIIRVILDDKVLAKEEKNGIKNQKNKIKNIFIEAYKECIETFKQCYFK